MESIKFKFKFLYNEPIKISVNIGSFEELKKKGPWPKSRHGSCRNYTNLNKIEIYVEREDNILSNTESILIHELVHAADIICEKYLYLNKEDIDTKAQIFRYLVEKSEKLLKPLELPEGFSKNTDILSIFLLGMPLKIEIISKIDGSNSVYYRKISGLIVKRPQRKRE